MTDSIEAESRAWAVTLMGIETVVYAKTRAEAKAMVAGMAFDAGYGDSRFDLMRRCWAIRAPDLDDGGMGGQVAPCRVSEG